MNPDAIKKLQRKLKPVLVPISLLYGTFLNIRDIYYSKKTPRAFRGVTIISVGNIVAGGVGKTPLVIELAKFFKKLGDTCVITNNYPLKDKQVHLVSLNGNIFKKPPLVSDEPYMIAKKVNVSVIASKNREAAIELASGMKSKYIILDDALHKRRIKKDLEICVVDKDKPFDNGLYIPAGMLRDTKRALKRCSFIVCIDKGEETQEKSNEVECINVKMTINGIFDKNGNSIEVKGKKAVVFCGIGDPQSFKKNVENLGIKIEQFYPFEDHHFYTKGDLEFLKKEKRRLKADLLITTFKDFVKLENESDIIYLDIGLNIENLKAHLKGFSYE